MIWTIWNLARLAHFAKPFACCQSHLAANASIISVKIFHFIREPWHPASHTLWEEDQLSMASTRSNPQPSETSSALHLHKSLRPWHSPFLFFLSLVPSCSSSLLLLLSDGAKMVVAVVAVNLEKMRKRDWQEFGRTFKTTAESCVAQSAIASILHKLLSKIGLVVSFLLLLMCIINSR